MAFTANDILTLAKAGFNSKQIAAMNAVQAQPAQQAQQAQPAQPTENDMFSQIMKQLQTNALNQTQQPAQQSTDDILAEIINPPTQEGGK